MPNTKIMKCTIKRLHEIYNLDLGSRYKCDEKRCLVNLHSWRKIRMDDQQTLTAPPPAETDLMIIAGEHSITQSAFENMVGIFFHPNTIPDPKVVSLAKINEYIKTPGIAKFQFSYDDTNTDDNFMTITLIPGIDKIVSVNYSSYLFQGILLLYPNLITEFHFYKAIDSVGGTVAIAAVDANSNVLYLGELSELYP